MSNAQRNPVKDAADTPHLRQALTVACDRAHLDAREARLIHHYSNAVYLLPREKAVARIMSGPRAVRRAQKATAVTGWLVSQGFAATAPLAGVPAVELNSSMAATFWIYYPQPAGRTEPTSAHLGRLIRQLHEAPMSPMLLEEWRPLRSLESSVRDPASLQVLSQADRDWLLGHIADVRADLAALDWPLGNGLIHADAWAGNLLWDAAVGPDAVVLGDWDSVCYGPREVDLIPSWHAAQRFGRGRAWADAFAETYGYDLSLWPGFETLCAMRDLIQLISPLRRAAHESVLARALQQRLRGIRSGDVDEVWQAF